MATETEKNEAVRKLEAAGTDLVLLLEALNEAKFLENVPGDHRQKFRAAKVQYRKLKQAADQEAAAMKDLPDEDITKFKELSESYETLSWRLESKPGGATVKPDPYYVLYGLYMQATNGQKSFIYFSFVSELVGDNETERPMWAEKGGIDFEGKSKWEAWTSRKGITSEKAKQEFVNFYYRFDSKALYKDTRSKQ